MSLQSANEKILRSRQTHINVAAHLAYALHNQALTVLEGKLSMSRMHSKVFAKSTSNLASAFPSGSPVPPLRPDYSLKRTAVTCCGILTLLAAATAQLKRQAHVISAYWR